MANYNNYSGENRFFINPYNFVSINLESDCQRKRISDELKQKRHTGKLVCKLFTKTPISIPDTSAPLTKGKHKEYNFVRTPDGKPMIPGSSIRGVIRNVYETITDSCFITSDEDQSITYRTKDPFKPGLLRKDKDGQIHLFKATRYVFYVLGKPLLNEDGKEKKDVNGNTLYTYANNKDQIDRKYHSEEEDQLSNYCYAKEVYIKPVIKGEDEEEYTTSRGNPSNAFYIHDMCDTPKEGYQTGYICIGEHFQKKHFESVFVKNDDEGEIVCKQEQLKEGVKNLSKVIKIYNDEKINKNAKETEFYKDRDYSNIEKEKFYPIWYSVDESNKKGVHNVYFSVANIGRSTYTTKMGGKLTSLKKEGKTNSHIKCHSRDSLCPACRLFGMANSEAIGSRIRFGDAIFSRQVNIPENRTTLKELSSPKPSYLPFYLKNKEVTKKWSYDEECCVIRGRKYYWHNTTKDFWKDTRKTERNSSVELIETNNGTSFDFAVYYDGLTDDELNTLIWALTLGENDKDKRNRCHKVGHGKPIGLGSSKIVVESKIERIINGDEYKIKKEEKPSFSDGDLFKIDISYKPAIEQLIKISTTNACTYSVDYPGIVDSNGEKYTDSTNKHAAHQWFTTNFSFGKEPEKVLPEILNVNDEQSALIWKTDAGRGGQNKGRTNALANKKYTLHEKYTGEITNYNLKKSVAYIKLDNGGKASLYFKDVSADYGRIDEVLPEGMKIKVQYCGKDGKYDKWKKI